MFATMHFVIICLLTYTRYHGFKSKSAWPARNSNWVRLKVIKQADEWCKNFVFFSY